MCWKDEWVKAAWDCDKAQKRIAKGQSKLETRLKKNMKTLESTHSPNEVKALIEKDERGIDICMKLIASLQTAKDGLHHLIETHGISRTNGGIV